MADNIDQTFSIDASQALTELSRLDAAYKQLNTTLDSTGAAFRRFNSGSQSANAALNQLGSGGARAYQQLGQAGQQSAQQQMNAFNRLISVNGKYSTSLALLARIEFTQLAIKGLRIFEQSAEAAIQSAIEFQTHIAEISTIAGGQLGSLDAIGESVKELASAWNTPLDQAATGLYQTISNQVGEGAQNVEFFNKALAFSKATLTDAAASVDLLSSTMNGFKLSLDQTNTVASQFNRVIELGAVTGKQLASDLPKVTPFAAQLGVTVEEVGAAFATMTIRGTKSAEVATQLKGIFSGLIKPTKEMEEALNRLGYSSAEEAIRAEGLGGLLVKLASTTDGTAAGMAKLFGNVRGLAGALSLGTQANEEYERTLAAIQGTSSGLNDSRALEIMATDAQVVSGAFNDAKIALTSFGEEINHVLANNIKFFEGVADGIEVLKGGAKILADPELLKKLATTGLTPEDGRKLFPGLTEEFDKTVASGQEKQAQDHADKMVNIEKRRAKDTQLFLNEAARAQKQEAIDLKINGANLLANAQGSATSLVNIYRDRNKELDKQINLAKSILQEAPGRIADIQTKRSNIEFGERIEGLDGGQQALAEILHAKELADKASNQYAEGARTGNKFLIDRARAGFQAAEQAANEAKSTALSAREKDRARQATQAMKDILDQQEAAERRILQISQSRLPTLESQKQALLGQIQAVEKAAKAYADASRTTDENGNVLTQDELAKNQEKRRQALLQLNAAGVPKDQLLKLTFDTETGIAKAKQDISRNFRNYKALLPFDVEKREVIANRRFTSPADVSKSVGEQDKRLQDLTRGFNLLPQQEQAVAKMRANIEAISKQQFPELQKFADEIKEMSKANYISPNRINELEERFKKEGVSGTGIDQAIKDLKALQAAQQNLRDNPAVETGAAQEYERLRDAADSSNRSTQSMQGALSGGVGPSAQIAANLNEAASASGRTNVNEGGGGVYGPPGSTITRAFGGLVEPEYHAVGGYARGTDQVPAMLTRGESVNNANSTAKYFSQIQAINTGHSPNVRNESSGSNVSIGDVTINSNVRTGGDIGNELLAQIARAQRLGGRKLR